MSGLSRSLWVFILGASSALGHVAYADAAVAVPSTGPSAGAAPSTGPTAGAAPEKAAPDAMATATDASVSPLATMVHRYTLVECIERAEANHPNLAAASSRLINAQAQLTEAKTAPFSDIRLGALGGVIPSISDAAGNRTYPTDYSKVSLDNLSGFYPTVRFTLDIRIPIYTFGKIEGYKEAATANVRLNEWDREKNRQQVRADVRRAYFGLQSARDGLYVLDEAVDILDKAIQSISVRIAKGEPGFEDNDRLRLEFVHDDLIIRRGDVKRLEQTALAGLRFLTGVQTGFEIPETPLARPETTVGPVIQYLTAARLYRPEINVARAGAAARTAQLKIARARLLPDFGFGVSGAYAFAPSQAKQTFSGLQDSAAFGVAMQWQLDFVPGIARIDQAKAQLEEVRNLQRLALGGIAVEVESQYAVVLEAMNREETWAKAEHRAKGWLVSVRDAIDLGTKDEKAVTEPLRYHLSSRAEHIRALFDLHIALSELARVSGWDAVAPK